MSSEHDSQPVEYFGPHAKRWTNPATGTTLSLSPRDYDRAVAQQDEEMRQLAHAKANTTSTKIRSAISAIEQRQERLIAEATTAAWDDEALVEGVVTIDQLGDPSAAPMAGMFKEEGVLIAPLGGWNQPEHQRYEMEVESSPVIVPPELAARYDAIVYGATRGGIRYPGTKKDPDEQASIIPGDYRLVASTDEGDKALLARGEIRYLNVSADDSLGSIRPVEQSVPGKPAARHFRRRKIGRNTLRLGLLYIIAVIGVISVAVEVLG